MHDHIVHFYHLSALDWVDVVSALKADPAKAAALAESLSPWPNNNRLTLKAVQDKLKGFVEAGQLGIFTNGYWGHPAMKLAPEVNLLAVSHYLQALDYQRKANQVVAILGGKTPNIQNLAVGGVANAINLDNQATLNMEKLYQVKDIIDEIKGFIQQVYFVDVCAIGAMYPDWLGYGAGVTNYLSVPDLPLDTKGTEFDFPGGVIMNGDLAHVQEIKTFNEPFFQDNVTESIAHAWYDGDWTRHPYEEDTVPKYSKYDADGKYSWIKSPRFDGHVMQVGPLAQVLVGFAQGHEPTNAGRQGARDRVLPREDDAHAGCPALDARPSRGADGAHERALRARAQALEAPRGQHRQGRHDHLQRAGVPEGRAARLRLPRGAARHALALDRHRGRQDRELPGGRALHVERRPARREGPAGAVRGVARRQPGGRCREAARGPAHDPLLRPVPRLRDSHAGSGGQRDRPREGPLGAPMENLRRSSVRVLGLGNVLMGDDALGPWVIQQLEATYEFPAGVSLVDVGTPGLDLIPYVAGPAGVLLVDTVKSGGAPGEIRVYDRGELLKHAAKPRLSPHDPGLSEALLAMELAGTPPRFVRLVGVVPEAVATGVGLSAAVAKAVPLAAQAVVRELALLGFAAGRRHAVSRPAPWWEAPVAEAPTLASR